MSGLAEVLTVNRRANTRQEARDWSTGPDGPGSGDDRYGDVPAQEEAA